MLQIPRQIPAGDGTGMPGRKLRILQIMPTYYPAVRYGGPIRSVHALAKGLVNRGHEVHVFTSSMDGPEDLDVPERTAVNLDGVLVHYFRVAGLRRFCWCPTLRTSLISQAAGFDIMHLHSVFNWPTWSAARVAKSAGVPFMLSPRGMLGRAVIDGKSRWLKSWWIRLIEQRSLLDSAGLHVTAESERAEITALKLRLPPMFCVPNGVSWPAQHSALSQGPLAGISKPYALFLSRIDWKKGLERLIEAWKWVPDLNLLIAGNDESGYRKKLERLIDEHLLRDRIQFLGPVADEHKWALYENALMFVLPSYSENFGNVVAEAMAMGCPVVVTPEVGLAGLVKDSGAGVVTDGAPRALAQTLRSLLQDAPRRRLMGERGKFTARRHLSWESSVAHMESIYFRILSNQVAARRSTA
jgi:glycosyltransferase involved in cell wall biosynthesis